MGAHSAPVFIGLGDVVGTDSDHPAIADLELTMQLNKPFMLAAVVGAETSAAQDQNHRMLSLQLGELPVFAGVVGQLIVGKVAPGTMSGRI